MEGFPVTAVQLSHALDRVGVVALWVASRLTLRVTFRNQPAGGHKRDKGGRHVRNGRGGLDLVRKDYGNLGLERPAVDLRRQHVDGPLRARLRGPDYLPGAGHVALLDRRADLLAPGELQSKGCHLRRSFSHGGRAFARLEDVDATAVPLSARVLFVHGGHGRYPAVLGQLSDLSAGQAIAARVEGGAGDDDIRFEAVKRLGPQPSGLPRSPRWRSCRRIPVCRRPHPDRP